MRRRFAGPKTIFLVFVTLVTCLYPSARANAQVVGATLNGTVADASGGAIAGAQISCKNVATDVTRDVTSDSAGFYTLPNLAPGNYTVTATAQGFSTEIRSGLVLTVGESESLNLTLTVGHVAQKIEVTGEASAVETTSSEISALVNSTTIVDLPLNGRSWTDLTILQRGVSVIATTSGETSTGSCNRGCGVQLTINGGRPQQNSYRIDGVSVNDKYNSAPGSQGGGGNLGVDTIQEFSVITDNQPAEYGRTSAGVINSITRSGGNSFHGTGFEFLRNSALDARNFFDPASGPPSFRRNQFGGSLGGPIKKNKTFFFAAYEGLRQSLGTTVTDFVPSEDAHNGIIATGKDPRDPTGVANCPCVLTVDPAIQLALALFPFPNAGLITPDQGRYTFASTNIINENFVDARIDHTFSTTDSINGTYQFDRAVGSFPDTFANQLLGNITQRQLATIAWTHIFNSAVVNTARFGYTRFTSPIGISLGAINPAADNPDSATVPGLSGQAAISLGSGFTANPGGLGGQAQSFSYFNTWQYYDDLFVTKGNHSMKFGVAAENDRQNYDNSTQTGGQWAFSGLGKFLINEPTSLSAQIPGTLTPRHVNQAIYAGYAQDDFRIRHNLTLNLGLRYEFATVPQELDGKVTNLHVLTDVSPTLGNPWWRNSSSRDFQPRIGFAWDPFGDGKSSVRGGFGMFDVLPLFYVITSQAAQAQPFFEVGSATYDGKADVQGYFPTEGYNCCLAGVTTSFRGTQFQFQPKRNYVMQWNLDLQHQITPSLSISAGYVGTRGVHQPTKSTEVDIIEPTLTDAGWLWPAPINVAPIAPKIVNGVCVPQGGKQRVNPCFGNIKATYWLSGSNYNGLVVQLEKRMAHGFYIQGSFTWSKSLDDSSSTQEGNGFSNSIGGPDLFYFGGSPNPTLIHGLDYGPSDFNVGRTLIINGIWSIPGPHSDNHLLNLAAKGWQVSGIFRASDGEPFTPTWGTSGNVTGSYGSTNNGFVNAVPDCKTTNPQDPVHYVNIACFTLPQAPDMAFWTANCDHSKAEVFPVCFNLRGTAKRNSIVGPGLANFDFSLFKNTYVTERLNIQFRAEFFNIANRANFGTPASSDLFNSSGLPIATEGAITSTATASREIQFGLKLIF
jgi:Carboxypeptidase regulatory-like domain/TonB-dependent Receptor Plug Domain/TonB dependent receptor